MKKYGVRLQYNVPGWAYYKRCIALQKYAPPDFDVSIGAWHPCDKIDQWPDDGKKWDLVLQLVPDHPAVRAKLDEHGMQDTLLVAGLNVGHGHHEERLRMCSEATDHIIVNNLACWEQLGKPKGMTWISNGVDLDVYRVTVPPKRRKPKVLWLGGEYHCKAPGQRKGTNIKRWHEILLPLADDLAKWDIEVDFCQVNSFDPSQFMGPDALVDWYNSSTVYVCASASEGTPNPALEAAACGCVVVSTPVGNMPELIEDGLNGCLVAQGKTDSVTRAGLLAAILHCHRMPGRIAEMATAMRTAIQPWHWKERSKQYFDLFRRLIVRGRV
jgi:glycosyltransferase involved in cell wall biosynthesis